MPQDNEINDWVEITPSDAAAAGRLAETGKDILQLSSLPKRGVRGLLIIAASAMKKDPKGALEFAVSKSVTPSFKAAIMDSFNEGKAALEPDFDPRGLVENVATVASDLLDPRLIGLSGWLGTLTKAGPQAVSAMREYAQVIGKGAVEGGFLGGVEDTGDINPKGGAIGATIGGVLSGAGKAIFDKLSSLPVKPTEDPMAWDTIKTKGKVLADATSKDLDNWAATAKVGDVKNLSGGVSVKYAGDMDIDPVTAKAYGILPGRQPVFQWLGPQWILEPIGLMDKLGRRTTTIGISKVQDVIRKLSLRVAMKAAPDEAVLLYGTASKMPSVKDMLTSFSNWVKRAKKGDEFEVGTNRIIYDDDWKLDMEEGGVDQPAFTILGENLPKGFTNGSSYMGMDRMKEFIQGVIGKINPELVKRTNVGDLLESYLPTATPGTLGAAMMESWRRKKEGN